MSPARFISVILSISDKASIFCRYRIKRSLKSSCGAGIVIKKIEKPKILYSDEVITMIYYPYKLAHSLWRSQEISLIKMHKNFLTEPILDLGCGDGSFTSILFDNIEYGIDPDEASIRAAKEYNLYKYISNVSAEDTGLRDNSVASILSNSVLEHIPNLQCVIQEIRRILIPDGVFMFTVPNNTLTLQLTKLFGPKEADFINGPYNFQHYNLLSNEEWIKLLNDFSLEIIKIRNYQDLNFTKIYRYMHSFLHRRVEKLFGMLYVELIKDKLINKVRHSITCRNGAGTFIICRKKE